MKPWWLPDIQSYIAAILTTSTILMVFVLIFHPIKDADQITTGAIGALLTVGFANIIAFYFGSSSGSKAKDDVISAMQQKQPPPAGGG